MMYRSWNRVCLFVGIVSTMFGLAGCTGDQPQRGFDVNDPDGALVDGSEASDASDASDASEVSDGGACECETGLVCAEGRCLVELGGTCEAEGDCARGSCREVGAQKLCTTDCEETCSEEGLTCDEGQCLPESFCSDPDGDTYGMGPACEGADCDEESADVHEGATEICNSIDDNCDGEIDELEKCECEPGETRSCYDGDPATRGRGTCEEGTQECRKDYTWGRCENQVLPGADICDGEDNDCDGAVDENLKCECTPGETRLCYTGPQGTEDVGRCSAGTQSCLNDHTWGACDDDVKPIAERCDGKDNDCDGDVDEDFQLNTDPLNCGACGNVCDVPNAQAACSSGECRVGQCHQNYWDNDGDVSNGCEYKCVSRGAEACNGRDDNCDGVVDDGFDTGSTCQGPGACGEGRIECLSPRETVCSTAPQGSNSEATSETCDGIDNDCDGEVDEPFTSLGETCTSGVGECETKGIVECASDGTTTTCGATPSQPETEICDGKDNDCDGSVDEECKLADSPWPTFKYNARRTGHNMNIQGPDSANQLWTASIGSTGQMNPVVDTSGDIYVGGGEHLYKFDAQGTEQWKVKLAGPASRPTLQSDGAIYVGGGKTFYCIRADGTIRWQETLSNRVGASIIGSDGDVYVTAGSELHAYRPEGTHQWTFGGGGRLFAPTIGQNDAIYTVAQSAIVYSVDANGNLNGKFRNQGADTDGGTSIGQSGLVYQPFGRVIYALEPALGSARWTVNAGGDIDSSVSIMNTGFQCCNPLDYPYVSPNGDNGLVKYDYTGTEQWRYSMQKDQSGNGAAIFDQDGDAFVGDSDGTYYAIDRSGSLKWEMDLSSDNIWAGAIDSGRVYVVSEGTLYALGN